MNDDFTASFLSGMTDKEIEAFSDAMCYGIYWEEKMKEEEHKDE